MKQTLLTRRDDVGVEPYDSIRWAFEVHVKQPDTGEYNSAVLYGSEDCPEMIDFFTAAEPTYKQPHDMRWLNPEYLQS